MDDLISKDYARKVRKENLDNSDVWYLPHHAVFHPQKPDKVRVVFDCSAKFQGTSLNDQLLQGPDLTNTLVGVLTRFRQEQIAFMSDIEVYVLSGSSTPQRLRLSAILVVARRRSGQRS